MKKKYRWEWLGEDRKGRALNALFKNNVPPKKRKSILAKLDITPEQRESLLKTCNIDWLVVENNKPILIEEKQVGVQRLKGSSLRISCGIPTQPQTLQRASELGIKTCVLVKFTVWGSLGPTTEGTIKRYLGYDDATGTISSKTYYWGETAFPSGKKIKLVDDFEQLANKLSTRSATGEASSGRRRV